jgi:hypothetical protein
VTSFGTGSNGWFHSRSHGLNLAVTCAAARGHRPRVGLACLHGRLSKLSSSWLGPMQYVQGNRLCGLGVAEGREDAVQRMQGES